MIKLPGTRGCGALYFKLQYFSHWNNSESEERVVQEKERHPFRSSCVYGFDMIKQKFSLPTLGMPLNQLYEYLWVFVGMVCSGQPMNLFVLLASAFAYNPSQGLKNRRKKISCFVKKENCFCIRISLGIQICPNYNFIRNFCCCIFKEFSFCTLLAGGRVLGLLGSFVVAFVFSAPERGLLVEVVKFSGFIC